ncbi:hypothetical protein BT96DRAFT_1088144 [Gymnopus androsaceus JB14]|uniref:DDE-1 domain-containing protein n=1 Tax=Gymnopus androsaceus JB14 TaxID=1447944 RepID=A0A6A4HYB5_9AGAR|nr:hypothetical protein BT96DRAFT_1088144 [Gymnopus androsaceus JB14]
MDGHSSHYSSELLDFCVAHNILLLGYPPHCTHALQGLDVVCFAKHKEEWKREIDAFKQHHYHELTRRILLRFSEKHSSVHSQVALSKLLGKPQA